ncbi:[Fe-Fe] hydrogenase large subunit C-terminal domain-containing protein [Treponema sp. J25]|uniref:[Fe-Fe] hydrogenase large subunit C-terminal domain-containing protein n=1 Tax=Treponema sp. J25 TaxID=2094121 RepID=UPI00105381C0|nr:[Fe-Fe] hydrogenase large subunit C-terminal domain-containing protein [Treponema sp. J25]TCW60672.1 Fe-S cluster protein [Treponema sp. J25]
MDILNPVYTEKAECQDCYKCVRECTVKAIKVEGGRATIIKDLCVLCGHCVEVCPVGAKRVRNDLPRLEYLLQSGKRVIASLAPSFVTEFPEYTPAQLVAALKKLGFWGVSETARGADLVARQMVTLLEQTQREKNSGAPPILISSACPTVVEYIQKYRPSYAPSIARCDSPLLAHCQELKTLYGEDVLVAFIGPCISKKAEADTFKELLEIAIDFTDLRHWLEEEHVFPHLLGKAPEDTPFLPGCAGPGLLYPQEGGMIEAILAHGGDPAIHYMSFCGMDAIDDALEELEKAPLSRPVFLELLACPGGCINGPRTRNRRGIVRKRLLISSYRTTRLGNSITAGGKSLPFSLERRWTIPTVSRPEFSEEAIQRALRETGKYSREDELNCGGCGYDSCRDFAQAMLRGQAEQGMCVSYMRKLAQKKANSLIKAIPAGVVIVDRDLRIVECNRHFVQLLGDEAEQLWEAKPGLEGADLTKLCTFYRYFQDILGVADTIERDIRQGKRIIHGSFFTIEQGQYAGGVFQDITAPWVQRDRIVSQARKVINKNLAVVQKIAFLLGENAAETEATLTSIIASFDSPSHDMPSATPKTMAPQLPGESHA